jgi:hypothetical protein
LKVNVIIEACYSGSFIDLAQEISKPGRVVITSTASNLNAFATSQGALFSDYFLEGLQQQLSLFASFQSANWAVGAARPGHDQQPWIDDNGDGQADNSDGSEAMRRGFTSAGTLGDELWPPMITEAESLKLPASASRTIRAKALDDLNVNMIWAVIYPPSYVPPEPGQELQAETLQTVTLLSQGEGWYSAQYPGFNEIGLYHIVIYAQDNQLLQAQPYPLEVLNGYHIFLPMTVRSG